MKARQFLESGSLGPDALRVAFQAFDEAWEALAGNFGHDPAVVEAARMKLANSILAAVTDESRDPRAVKDAALAALAANYRLSLADKP